MAGLDPADEERDIADDPLASAVNRDRERVLKRIDHRLLLWLAVIVVATLLYRRSSLKSAWIDLAIAAAVVGVILFTIFSAIRQQITVAARYGLVCQRCGHTPMPHELVAAATVQRCSKCRGDLRLDSKVAHKARE